MLSRRHLLKSGAASGLFAVAASCAPKHIADEATSLGELDTVGLVNQIAAGRISADEALEAAIARAEAAEPHINALTNTYFDMARQAAPVQGPFSGAPYLIKDLLNWEGTTTTFGCRAFDSYVAQNQTPYMQALLDAGLRPFAKTASPEVGLLASTEPLANGPTRNPWNTDHIPGGSSGGAAAAVAAGVTPMAHASDGGGSIRIPASCCGLFGLKPSRDRMPSFGDEEAPVRLSVQHAVSRTVRDSAALLAAVERKGADRVYDPTGMVADPVSRRLKIGLVPQPLTGLGADPEVIEAVSGTAQLCTDLGHEVIDYSPKFNGEEFIDAFLIYWGVMASGFVDMAERMIGAKPTPENFEPWTLGLRKATMETPQEKIAWTIKFLHGIEASYDAMFNDIDILLTPTLAKPPYRIGETAPTVDYDVLRRRTIEFVGYTPLQNAAGAPAMSVPLSWSAKGLPIGSHFSARKGEDGLLLALAYQLEAAKSWSQRKPAVWVG